MSFGGRRVLNKYNQCVTVYQSNELVSHPLEAANDKIRAYVQQRREADLERDRQLQEEKLRVGGYV